MLRPLARIAPRRVEVVGMGGVILDEVLIDFEVAIQPAWV